MSSAQYAELAARLSALEAVVPGPGGGATTNASDLITGTLADARLPAGSNAATVGAKATAASVTGEAGTARAAESAIAASVTAEAVTARAAEAQAVKLTGAQTVAGVKNFTSTPTVNGVLVALSAPVVPGTAPVWVASQIGDGVVGEYFSFTYVASGNPALITYAVTGAGVLPPGLSLNGATGAVSGTPTTAGIYTFTVTASNGVAPDLGDPEQAGRERTVTITAAPVTVGSSTIYGPGIGSDTKSNIPITAGQKMAYKFKAAVSAALTGVRFTQRSGPGGLYSQGTGGTMTVSVRADDGAGHPAATALATLTFNPAANNSVHTEIFDLKTFGTPATLTAGTVYWIVFTGSSDSNFISVNLIMTYNAVVPRQPGIPDADFGMIYTSGAWGALNSQHTPVLDLVYAGGTIQGQPYYEAMILHWRAISGASQMVRERFTVSGGDKTVLGARVRVRRGSGTSPLVMSLVTTGPGPGSSETGVVDSVTVTAASVPISSPGGDDGGSVWVGGNFSAPRVLTNGANYALRLSTASGTTYTAHPMRSTKDGVAPFASPSFEDGDGEYSVNGSSWQGMYAFDDQDVQMYFTLA